MLTVTPVDAPRPARDATPDVAVPVPRGHVVGRVARHHTPTGRGVDDGLLGGHGAGFVAAQDVDPAVHAAHVSSASGSSASARGVLGQRLRIPSDNPSASSAGGMAYS